MSSSNLPPHDAAFSNVAVKERLVAKVGTFATVNAAAIEANDIHIADAPVVVGPGLSTDTALALWNGTTGNALSNSSVTYNDTTDKFSVLSSASTVNATTFYQLNGSKALAAPNASSLAVGVGALTATTGVNNVALGQNAGATVTTGTGNVFLGRGADAASATVSNSIVLGNGASSTASGQLVLHGIVSGTATLVAGTVTVATTAVTANTIVIVSRKTIGGTAGNLSFVVTAGTNIVITSSSNADTSTVTYFAFEP